MEMLLKASVSLSWTVITLRGFITAVGNWLVSGVKQRQWLTGVTQAVWPFPGCSGTGIITLLTAVVPAGALPAAADTPPFGCSVNMRRNLMNPWASISGDSALFLYCSVWIHSNISIHLCSYLFTMHAYY